MNAAQNLTRSLGGDWHGQRGLAPCPVCQPERRRDQRGLSITEKGSGFVVFCHKAGCPFKDIARAAKLPWQAPASMQNGTAPQKPSDTAQRERARRLWSGARSIDGTRGETYFRGRGISCALPSTLRWHPEAYHAPTASYLAAIVADVTTGGVHRTFFDRSGRRLSESAKMMQGPCAGGAVVLSKSRGPLVVCEGIETGLSLMSGILSCEAAVWAALSASLMRTLVLPDLPGELILATDSDDAGAGREAGAALAARATAMGWNVMFMPAPEGQDWNDVLMERKGLECKSSSLTKAS